MLQDYIRETMGKSLEDLSPFCYKETPVVVVFIYLPTFFLSLLIHILLVGLENADNVIPMQLQCFIVGLTGMLLITPVFYLFLRLLLILRRQGLVELSDVAISFLAGLIVLFLTILLASRVGNVLDRITNAIAEKRAKLKYTELANICCNLREGGSSLEEVERWLNENQDNFKLLKQAASYRDENGIHPHVKYSTPLHYLVCSHPPFQLVQRILQLAPNTIEKKNKWGYLPLHDALSYNASPDVIKMLFETYPNGAKIRDCSRCLPLHYACITNASLDIIKMLLEAHPQAAEVQSKHGKDLPLHHACYCKDSLDIIKLLLDAYPNGAKVQKDGGLLPLHIACYNNASPDVIKMLIEAYPQAAEVQNDQELPLHAACSSNAPLEVIKILFEAYPKAVEVKNRGGNLPLHLLCHSITGSTDNFLKSLDLLLVAYLNSIDVKDNSGRTISDYLKPRVIPEFLTHYAIIGGFSTHLVKLLLQAEPESCRKQDSTGMVPLHYACASNAPHFFDYVVALLDAGVEDSLKIQDNQGRTAAQIATQAASITDENGRLPLHRLASRSNNLTVKALNLLVDAYPDSITFPDKFGMLPFHHACLNEASSLEVLMFFINSFPESLEVF